MATRSVNLHIASVRSIQKRILRDYWTPADAKSQLQYPDMKESLVALRVSNLWQNTATETLQDVEANVREEAIEVERDMPENEYITAFWTVYATPKRLTIHDRNSPSSLL